MEKQIVNAEIRNNLVLQLAKDNANEDCQKVIELIPNENPSLNDLINACAKVRSDTHKMTMLADSITPIVKVTPQCFKCGQ